MFRIDGLASGIDTSTIIEGLMGIKQRQLDRLVDRQQQIVTRQAALRSIEAQVLALRGAANSLTRTTAGPWGARKVTSSDETRVVASAARHATEGTYQLRVEQLAAAHQIASASLESAESQITHGTFTIRVGNRPAITVTIDENNDTLAGLAGAINQASADVNATIVNDGANARLLIASKFTGAANAITITNELGDSTASAQRPDFAGPAVQEAADAVVLIGSGPGAISFSRPTNQVDGLIDGVTLDLRKAGVDDTVVLVVARDTDLAKNSIKEFVESFNKVMNMIDEVTSYQPEAGLVGVLQGNRSVIDIQNRLRGTLAATVAGVSQAANRLSAIGVQFTDRGRLTLDSARLDAVLSGSVSGINEADVRRLFAFDGQSSNSGVQFLLSSSRTKAPTEPIQVQITTAAKQAVVTATLALPETLEIDSSNDQLSLHLDGLDVANLNLTHGTYTRAQIAEHVAQVIHAHPDLKGRAVSVSLDGDQLRIRSLQYGSSSSIHSLGGSAAVALGFDGTESGTGVNVAGHFIVNGVIEPATGNGRTLRGSQDNANTADLQVLVTLNESQLVDGPEAELLLTRGLASSMDQLLGSMLDPVNGSIKNALDGMDQSIESLDRSVDRLEQLFERQREKLLRQFQAMETMVSQLQTTSNFLAAQLVNLQTQQPRRR